MTTRRKFLGISVSATMIPLTGCIDDSGQNQPATDNPSDTQTDELDIQNPTPASQQEFENWEPDTNCNTDQADAMVNSEISITKVRQEIKNGYQPISYTDLPKNQKEILAIALTQGGYALCDETNPFSTFFENAVEQGRNQEKDDLTIYLEYDNKYYQLYLRRDDQVYAY